MKFPTLKTASAWRDEHPGHRALVLLINGGRDVRSYTIILPASSPAPNGLYRMLGTIE